MSTSLAKTLLTVSLLIINRQEEHNSLVSRNEFDQVYDYIVVGAGTAGSVVAARLAEQSDIKILLIESGGAETVVSDMPAMFKSLWGSDMDWKFEISSQSNSFLGYNKNKCAYSQGKVMGGSSTINAMAYVRGLKLDFDNWKHSYGVQGWDWDQVLPYFMRSENNLSVWMTDKPGIITQTMIKAAQELGYHQINLNDPTQPIGVAVQPMTIRDGSRSSSATTFLKPVINQSNIHIMANSLVTKINFDGNQRAVSVDIQRMGQNITIRARKEIIISAGAINTAKLLMLSGVGPKDHLKEHGIPLVADLPVGHNFNDNPITFGVHFTTNLTKTSKQLLEKDISDYFLNNSGPMSQFDKPVLRVGTGIEKNSLWPDMKIFVESGSLSDFPNSETAEKALNLKPEIWDQFYKPYSGQSTLTFIPLLNRPLSRGRIQLMSNRYEDKPIVDPNYFNNTKDIKSMIEGMKIAFSLGQSKPFADTLNAKPFQTRVPNCQSLWLSSSASNAMTPSDQYLECVAKTLTNTYTHAAGTCRMGALTDHNSVVSSQLQVHGLNGLRVVDASVVPQSPSGALYATAVMIGQRGAQFILDDYHKYYAMTAPEPRESSTVSKYFNCLYNIYLLFLNMTFHLIF